MKAPEKINLTHKEKDDLIRRIEETKLSKKDQKMIIGLINMCLWLQNTLERSKVTIGKLRKLLGFTSEKRKSDKTSDDDKNGGDTGGSQCGSSPASSSSNIKNNTVENDLSNEAASNKKEKEKKKPSKGHGRNKADSYVGATTVTVAHKTLQHASACLDAPICNGKVYTLQEPGIFISVSGNAVASATRYELQRFRCNLCGKIFTAELPAIEGRDSPKDRYDYSTKSMLAIFRYYMGMPFYRLERLQKFIGVPLPDSTQWDLVEEVGNSVYPVFMHLEKLAANGNLVHHDDTRVNILSMVKENLEKNLKRKGMFTTALLSYVGKHRICIFISGRKHAGENLEELLGHRDGALELMLQMCDALPANKTKEIKTILCHCLSHARRKFIEIESFFPNECKYILNTFSKVYKHDAEAKKRKLNDQERLEFHQKHSAPFMTLLLVYLQATLDKNVEKNSALGSAIIYTIKHWNTLTSFLQVAGAPLDNNIVEQALKIFIRSRKSSLFFKTDHSAQIGSILSTVIYTCCLNGYNPIEYLNALQKNSTLAHKNPQDWLPWNYQQTIFSFESLYRQKTIQNSNNISI